MKFVLRMRNGRRRRHRRRRPLKKKIWRRLRRQAAAAAALLLRHFGTHTQTKKNGKWALVKKKGRKGRRWRQRATDTNQSNSHRPKKTENKTKQKKRRNIRILIQKNSGEFLFFLISILVLRTFTIELGLKGHCDGFRRRPPKKNPVKTR